MTERMILADCLLAMPKMEPESIASCVTDPPYGLKFMGKAWDHGVPGELYWREVLRVLQPGGHLVAFGGTRTHHRLMVAIEDAGFEIRDCLMWLHGQGFPKGKGQLKPAWEPIVLARKPAPAPWLNVEGCRVSVTDADVMTSEAKATKNGHLDGETMGYGAWAYAKAVPISTSGRWPANVVLSHEPECREVGTKRVKASRLGQVIQRSKSRSQWRQTDSYCSGYADNNGLETVAAWECMPECAVRMLDEQSGERPNGYRRNPSRTSEHGRSTLGKFEDGHERGERDYQDFGGASRFFYCAKASRKERGAYNDWPTVKPLALMRWLVKLVTPVGGVVLDPFCGSGSTLLAARNEGFDVIGIDNDPHAFDITRKRLGHEEAPALIVGDRVRILAVRRQPREAGRE